MAITKYRQPLAKYRVGEKPDEAQSMGNAPFAKRRRPNLPS
jgi:hypothetical protein